MVTQQNNKQKKMEKQEVSGYIITTHRKNTPRLALELRERAIYLLSTGQSLEAVSREMDAILCANKRNSRIYVSYWKVTGWDKKENLYIRNTSEDCSYVSIRQK